MKLSLFECSNQRVTQVRKPKRDLGFTLLELVVTLTILGLVLVMVLGLLRLGSSSWERGEAKADHYQKQRIVLNLLSQQVKSSFPYKIKAQKAEGDYIAFLGARDSLRFVSTFSVTAKRPEGLVFVIYRVEEGKDAGKILKVFEKRVLNKDFMEETPDEEKFLTLLEDLSEFGFEYFQEGEEEEEVGEWAESWDGKDKRELPRQMRMVAKWGGGKREEEETLTTLVAIPTIRYDDRTLGRGRPIPQPTPKPPSTKK
jgi:general secretion pathway protein J